MDEVSVQEQKNGKAAEARRELSPEEVRKEVDRICADPKNVLEALNELLTANGKAPLSEERMLQTGDEASVDGARKYLQRQQEYVSLMGKYHRPDAADDFARIYTLFLKPERNEDDVAENRRFVQSLGTPQGRRDLFYRCVEILEKADKSVFLQKDQGKILAAAGADPDLFLLAGVVKSTLAVYAGRPEMADVRINNPELIASLRDASLYEVGVGIDAQARLYQDRNSVMLRNLNVDELTVLMNPEQLKKTQVQRALMMRLQGAIGESLTAAFDRGDFSRDQAGKAAADPTEVGRLLSEKSLLTGQIFFADEDGVRMKQEAGIRALAEGKPVHLRKFEDCTSISGTDYLISVKGNTLQYQGQRISREPEYKAEYDPKLAEAAQRLEDYEAEKKHVFFKDEDGREMDRKEVLQAFLEHKTIQAFRFDEAYPYLGKAERIMMRSDGEMETVPDGIGSRRVDLAEFARTPEQQLKALENVKKSLEQTHKTGYFGLLKDSTEFSETMKSLTNTIRLLKDPKNLPDKMDIRIQFEELEGKVNRYLEMKELKIRQRTDRDWVGLSRMDTLHSLKSLLNDNVAEGLAAYRKTAAAEKQAAPKQAAPSKKNEVRAKMP